MDLNIRIENAIRWIDALDTKEGYRKTINRLGRVDQPEALGKRKIFAHVKDYKTEARFCCLGVACLSLKMENEIDLSTSYDNSVEYPLGLNTGAAFMDMGFASVKLRLKEDGSTEVFDRNHVPEGSIAVFFESLPDINDRLFEKDVDFSRVRKFILENLDYTFIPEVAEGLKKHYNK